MEDNAHRVAELHWRLVEVADPVERAAIHLELGRIAMKQGQLTEAAQHFREALWHDARLEAARTALHSLSLDGPKRGRPVSGLRALWSRIRSKMHD